MLCLWQGLHLSLGQVFPQPLYNYQNYPVLSFYSEAIISCPVLAFYSEAVIEWLLSRHQIHSAAGLTAKAGLVEPKSSWRSTLLRSASPKDIFCGHFLFPGSFILEYFFRLQQGCHLRSLERRHQCFDRVWKKLLKHYRAFDRSVYHVTNKCYNGRLYPCQCLEFGYLIRFDSSQFFCPKSGLQSQSPYFWELVYPSKQLG